MRIGINLLFLKQQVTGGTDTYAECLLKAFEKNKSGDDVFFIFCSTAVEISFLHNHPSFAIVKYKWIDKSILLRVFFEQFIFPLKLKKHKLDILHSLGYIGPVFFKKHIVTMHDANAFALREIPVSKRILLAALMKLTARNCSHIITVSLFSKEQIMKYLRLPENKISVVYEGSKFVQTLTVAPLPYKYSWLENERYFVALTSITKNKNIETLIMAFEKTLQHIVSVKLVLTGHMPVDNSIQQLIKKVRLEEKIFLTGYVDDETLKALFQHAVCFIFPSLYEGFGLPLLEAQALGVAVIASNRASLPEIGAGSAIYFDARSAAELAERMLELAVDTEKRNTYRQYGYKNLQRFSWDNTAVETMSIYRKFIYPTPQV